MKARRVSEAVIRRLPRYYRQLEMLFSQGVERISSNELAQQMNLNASQVRQDFNCFGGFGQQGYGYHVPTLYKEISNILGLDRTYKTVIVGAGNIGQALCNYDGFFQKGFQILALFDINEELVGKTICDRPIYHVDELESYIRQNNIDIGVITAKRRSAQAIADTLVAGGIRSIWNFVPIDISAPVPIENVHLTDSMFTLAYKLNNHFPQE